MIETRDERALALVGRLRHLTSDLRRLACRTRLDLLEPIAVANAYGEASVKMDQVLDDFLLEHLARDRDVAEVYSEESGRTRFRPSGYLLVVDPLDGTRNFHMGLSYYATAIAVVQPDGEVVGGYVANLSSGSHYSSASGYPSRGTRNRRLASSQNTDLAAADGIYVGLSKDERELEALARMARALRSVRAMGCSALDVCCLASGGCDVFVDFSNTAKLVDILASAFIAEQAGGIVTTTEGTRVTELLVGTPNLAEAVFGSRFRTIAGANRLSYRFARRIWSESGVQAGAS